ncbi:sensor histidine kinase [Naumannella sp. ID2617S]|nr:sensor histidine kinase [Naumannella sp. ID2617S]
MALSRRMLVLLDVIIGVLVLVNLVSAATADPSQLTPLFRGFGVVGSTLVGGAWILWRVLRRRWVLLIALAMSVPASLGGGGAVPLMLTVLLISLVTVTFDLRFGVAGLLLFVLAGIAAMAAWDVPLAGVLVEALAALLLGGVGLVLGQLLRELAAERRTNHQLLDELRAAHDLEKELMLADERSRSARELHDGLGHRLTLIGMSLEYADRVRESAPQKAFEEVAHAREQASEALAYMRRWVRALNPPRETNLSGIAAFEALADSFRGTGLKVRVSQTGTEHPLGREASLFAYRLVQEGLTNVLRHSAADEVDLTVHWQDEGIRIELEDNGAQSGTPDLTDAEPGFGLRSLAERAEQLGGGFSAQVAEKGVRLSGVVPAKAGQ